MTIGCRWLFVVRIEVVGSHGYESVEVEENGLDGPCVTVFGEHIEEFGNVVWCSGDFLGLVVAVASALPSAGELSLAAVSSLFEPVTSYLEFGKWEVNQPLFLVVLFFVEIWNFGVEC